MHIGADTPKQLVLLLSPLLEEADSEAMHGTTLYW